MSSKYHASFTKIVFDYLITLLILPFVLPAFLLIALIVLFFSGWPIFFLHKRIGKDGKVFKMIKFRTMVKDAEKNKYKYKKLNEASGPVFKIENDPRFTKIGKVLSKTALDELPQLLNVIKGDMSLVGPRPLPVDETNKLNSKDKSRNAIKPGLTSLWVINGSHKLTFKKWMELDRSYVKNANLFLDFKIILKTFGLVGGYCLRVIKR